MIMCQGNVPCHIQHDATACSESSGQPALELQNGTQDVKLVEIKDASSGAPFKFPRNGVEGSMEKQVMEANSSTDVTKSLEHAEEQGCGSTSPHVGDLCVRGLAWTTTDESLKDYFSQFGQVTLCEVKKEPDGRSKGYGFVNFKKAASVDGILDKTHVIDNRTVEVRPPRERQDKTSALESASTNGKPPAFQTQGFRSSPPRSTKMDAELAKRCFVGLLPASANEEHLESHFSRFGEVSSIFLPRPIRGFAFVTFSSERAAQAALEHEDHVLMGVRLQVKSPTPKQPSNQKPPSQRSSRATSPTGSSGSAGSANAFPMKSNGRSPNHRFSPPAKSAWSPSGGDSPPPFPGMFLGPFNGDFVGLPPLPPHPGQVAAMQQQLKAAQALQLQAHMAQLQIQAQLSQVASGGGAAPGHSSAEGSGNGSGQVLFSNEPQMQPMLAFENEGAEDIRTWVPQYLPVNYSPPILMVGPTGMPVGGPPFMAGYGPPMAASGAPFMGSGTRLFVSNIHFHASWQEIRNLFCQHGSVLRVDILRDENGQSRGKAIIQFATSDDASNAFSAVQNHVFRGRQLIIREDK